MRVFLDTNVWVAAVATNGLCQDLVTVCLSDHVVLTCDLSRRELFDVVSRKLRPPNGVLKWIKELWAMTVAIEDAPLRLGSPDERLVAAAATAGADLFVTEDKEVLARRHVGPMRIVSPRDAWLILLAAPPAWRAHRQTAAAI
ncbi:MAG: hypothetical protein HYX75_16960 [Acidobacteria bacterium]|nr:hypothetical protein [Acidobacteriota bacterium]